ncbi:hypothetical protein BN1013_01615 [Candidatus Rubidus massiliensis]|nr:hypothetical protein BN1013_01615 [Candidatus Rubidus massiliensis]
MSPLESHLNYRSTLNNVNNDSNCCLILWKKIAEITMNIVNYIFYGIKKTAKLFDINDGLNVDEDCRLRCIEFKTAIKTLKLKIKQIDDIIFTHKDLHQLCINTLKQSPYRVAVIDKSKLEKISVNDPDYIIKKAYQLDIKITRLEHYYKERIMFIDYHNNIKELFIKYCKEDNFNCDNIFLNK